ncbi:BadF/BadG/BcrA/BcrD ATPase family protein [Streptomyces sp. MST-110588]|uniref:N-acetylglucosamine kinase n=1 Tax=Streptomyces sp. MST-110588 TaxID=2833628 RepID=UPI001F5D6540|nr:BadF/BadG/BcrA/BcrD ATPase family protein [Streptomyces sp. MST-110588]UNO44152.1 ATPase [Streptomyces sp. MST-110588]
MLAIDAGNSKTDVALVRTDGTLLGSARGGGFQPPRAGAAQAVEDLAPAVATALARAGATGPVDHVSACLANADFPAEEAGLTDLIAARGWARTVTVRNDTLALLRAGLPDFGTPVGVAVVCGAGINCAGVGHGGSTARFPSLGRISGDWGGGGFLAHEALWYAARADDGRGERTALARALPAHFGLPGMPELIEALHLGHVPERRRHEMAPVLFAVAADGDAVARAIVDRQAQEVVVMATVALERLDLLDEPTPVVLGGSVLAARHPLLNDQVVRLLAERAPKAVPQVVTAPPVLGAALHALDRAGAAAPAYERLRGGTRSRRPWGRAGRASGRAPGDHGAPGARPFRLHRESC